MHFQRLEMSFSFYIQVIIILLYERVLVRIVVFWFLLFGFVQQHTSIWYHMLCNIGFIRFWGALFRPTAGAVVLVRKCTTPQSVPWLCASIQKESCVIVSGPSTATPAVTIA